MAVPKWVGAIAGAVPAIAKALGGPVAVAAPALAAVSRALLGHESGTEGDVEALLAQGVTPEQIAKLREAEREFGLKLVDAAVQLEELEMRDRENARAREIALKDRMPALLAILLTVALIGTIALLGTRAVPTENREPFLILLGALSTAWTGAMAYYHGSSSSSRAKDTVLGRLASTK